MQKACIFAVLITLIGILSSSCGPATYTWSGGPLPPVVAQGTQLKVEGRTFEIRGINYIHPSNADLSKCSAIQFGADPNCPWDIAPIAADFDHLQKLGVNTIRVFLNYYVFGGAKATNPNYSTERPLAYFDELVSEAGKRGIYVMPVLLAKYPQDRFGPDAYDTALTLHVRPVVSHVVGKPGVIAWDLFNEIDLGGPVDERCWDWDNGAYEGCFPLAQERLHFINTVNDEVKRLDPERLTTVSLGFAKNYFRPEGADLRLADVVDFYSFHYYDDDPYNSGRYAAHWYYGQGFPADFGRGIDELYALKLDKPVAITEIGFPTGADAKRTIDELQRDLRTAYTTAQEKQTAGIMLWPFQTDTDVLVGNLFTKR
jgi:hypothetical protein